MVNIRILTYKSLLATAALLQPHSPLCSGDTPPTLEAEMVKLMADVKVIEEQINGMLSNPTWWKKAKGTQQLDDVMATISELHLTTCAAALAPRILVQGGPAVLEGELRGFPVMEALIGIGGAAVPAIVGELVYSEWHSDDLIALAKARLLARALLRILEPGGQQELVAGVMIQEARRHCEDSTATVPIVLRSVMKELGIPIVSICLY